MWGVAASDGFRYLPPVSRPRRPTPRSLRDPPPHSTCLSPPSPPPPSPRTGRSGAGRRTTATPPRRASRPSAGPDKNVVWKPKMPGRGSSTPCVWGDRIVPHRPDGQPTSSCSATAPTGRRSGSGRWGPAGSTPGPTRAGTRPQRVRVVQHRRQARLGVRRRPGKLACLRPRRQAGLGDRPAEGLRQVHDAGSSSDPLDPGAAQGPALHAASCTARPDADRPRQGDRQARSGRSTERATARRGSRRPDVYASPFVWERGTAGRC